MSSEAAYRWLRGETPAPPRRDGGSTLVELLVVMVVIGVLAAIAVPVFLSQRQEAQETALRADLRNVAAQVLA